MKYLVIVLAMVMLTACVPPKVIMSKDMCVKYEATWLPEKAIPAATVCVCTEDVYTGLVSALTTMVSMPDTIELKGVMVPADCVVKDKTANVPDSVKDVLVN